MMITKLSVVPMDGQDDDWLVFEFGSPDAAAGHFTVPSNKRLSKESRNDNDE